MAGRDFVLSGTYFSAWVEPDATVDYWLPSSSRVSKSARLGATSIVVETGAEHRRPAILEQGTLALFIDGGCYWRPAAVMIWAALMSSSLI